MTEVSVIVVTLNTEKTIAQCLESLVALDFPDDAYEIIVVDGASSDTTREICQGFPVKLVCLDKAGISYQRNSGISAAQGKYIAFTDADCVVEKTWLSNLVSQIKVCPADVIAVGGPNLIFQDDPPLSRIIGYAQETLLGSGGSPQSYEIKKSTYVISIPNCNILYRKEAFEKEQYNDTLSVGDDCDLNFRLRQRGYKFLYLNYAIVWHHRMDTFPGFIHKMIQYGEALGVITRHHKKTVRWYAPATALAVIIMLLAYPLMNLNPAIAYAYVAAVALYIVALVITTAQVCRKYRGFKALATLILIPLQHFSYGIGFIKGFLSIGRPR